MKAIETTGKIDKKGNLILDNPLEIQEKKVKILILFSEEESNLENEYLYAISQNPSFDFLKEKEEDIYTIKNGKPFKNDKK